MKSNIVNIETNFDAISFISETKSEVYNMSYIADSVDILGIVARNMPMWQRDRNMAKVCCAYISHFEILNWENRLQRQNSLKVESKPL